jgi:hypothetical protein
MVSLVLDNRYQLREHYLLKVQDDAQHDVLKSSWLKFLGLSISEFNANIEALSLFQHCALSGLNLIDEKVETKELNRLLGQAPKIDSTPMPWASDIFSVLAIAWFVESIDSTRVQDLYLEWISKFIPTKIQLGFFDPFEHDLAVHLHSKTPEFKTACIPLLLDYLKIRALPANCDRHEIGESFMTEFTSLNSTESSTVLKAFFIYVFDIVDAETASVPPHYWQTGDLVSFLENIPVGLRRWTWENVPRTSSANDPVRWRIENEYHVQNLLYLLLAPVFVDICDEVSQSPVGQKSPRIDLYLPSIDTIIEVKYRKNTRKSFQMFIGEIAEDASLYKADPTYKDSQFICLLWDHTRSTQEHSKFINGVNSLPGVDGCVVISSPSVID